MRGAAQGRVRGPRPIHRSAGSDRRQGRRADHRDRAQQGRTGNVRQVAGVCGEPHRGLAQDRPRARQGSAVAPAGAAEGGGMNIHEYQAKAILKGYGAPVSNGVAIAAAADAEKAAREAGGPPWVVKAQIHAGGRGKGRFKEAAAGDKGGVRLARSPKEVADFVRQMLGATLITKQTGSGGRVVRRVYVEAAADIERELYLSCLVDRSVGRVAFIVSQAGGMDIEEVAHKTPEKIVTVHVDPLEPSIASVGAKVAAAFGLGG